jgi:hypothetical protein
VLCSGVERRCHEGIGRNLLTLISLSKLNLRGMNGRELTGMTRLSLLTALVLDAILGKFQISDRRQRKGDQLLTKAVG